MKNAAFFFYAYCSPLSVTKTALFENPLQTGGIENSGLAFSSVDGKQLEDAAFRDYDFAIIMLFPCLSFSQIQIQNYGLLLRFSNFSGTVRTGPVLRFPYPRRCLYMLGASIRARGFPEYRKLSTGKLFFMEFKFYCLFTIRL